MVVVVWLFVVLVLTSSYTASLSSMLTVERLEPKVEGIEWLRKTNATVGCDGGSFVFQKGSPIARDVSEAILTITEKGNLKKLETKWFPLRNNCSASKNTDSLTIDSFWVIYLMYGATSTVCFLIFIAKLLVLRRKKDQNQRNEGAGDISAEEGNLRKAIAIVRYIHKTNNRISPINATSFYQREDMGSSRWKVMSPSEAVEHGIQLPEIKN